MWLLQSSLLKFSKDLKKFERNYDKETQSESDSDEDKETLSERALDKLRRYKCRILLAQDELQKAKNNMDKALANIDHIYEVTHLCPNCTVQEREKRKCADNINPADPREFMGTNDDQEPKLNNKTNGKSASKQELKSSTIKGSTCVHKGYLGSLCLKDFNSESGAKSTVRSCSSSASSTQKGHGSSSTQNSNMSSFTQEGYCSPFTKNGHGPSSTQKGHGSSSSKNKKGSSSTETGHGSSSTQNNTESSFAQKGHGSSSTQNSQGLSSTQKGHNSSSTQNNNGSSPAQKDHGSSSTQKKEHKSSSSQKSHRFSSAQKNPQRTLEGLNFLLTLFPDHFQRKSEQKLANTSQSNSGLTAQSTAAACNVQGEGVKEVDS